VGWSLGGQLAVRAIAAGMLQPKALVLIAAPFQFVASQEPLGMKRDLYEKFRDNYARNPARTLDKAWELVVKDDARHEHVRSHIARQDKQAVMQRNWLYWLNALDGFSCDTLDMQAFPHTLLVYGQKDSVVAHEQHTHFAQRLPHADIISLPECGHAPHWHDGQVIAHWVSKHV
jgi:pimeloyl-ACP methyl ester carboxylesterase